MKFHISGTAYWIKLKYSEWPYYTYSSQKCRNAEEYTEFTRHFSKIVNIARREKNLYTIAYNRTFKLSV